MKLDPQIQLAIDAGLMTEADGIALDAWAEELAQAVTSGEITEAEKDRRILERLTADLQRRGQA